MKIAITSILSIILLGIIFFVIQFKPFLNENLEFIKPILKDQASIDHRCPTSEITIVSQSGRLFVVDVCGIRRFYKWYNDNIIDITNSKTNKHIDI